MAKDYPFNEIKAAVEDLSAKGWECYQKFTCERCGQRLTMDEPNTLYKTGSCDQCGHITNIAKNGCNYLLVGKFPQKAEQALPQAIES